MWRKRCGWTFATPAVMPIRVSRTSSVWGPRMSSPAVVWKGAPSSSPRNRPTYSRRAASVRCPKPTHRCFSPLPCRINRDAEPLPGEGHAREATDDFGGSEPGAAPAKQKPANSLSNRTNSGQLMARCVVVCDFERLQRLRYITCLTAIDAATTRSILRFGAFFTTRSLESSSFCSFARAFKTCSCNFGWP